MPIKSVKTYEDCTTAGDDYVFDIRWGYGTDSIDTPYDLTDCTFRAQLRDVVVNNTIAATFTCVSPDPADGLISCSLDSTQTGSLVFKGAFRNYVYDVEVIDINGKVSTIIVVNLKIRKGVTR